jgi:hypothetical protein
MIRGTYFASVGFPLSPFRYQSTVARYSSLPACCSLSSEGQAAEGEMREPCTSSAVDRRCYIFLFAPGCRGTVSADQLSEVSLSCSSRCCCLALWARETIGDSPRSAKSRDLSTVSIVVTSRSGTPRCNKKNGMPLRKSGS